MVIRALTFSLVVAVCLASLPHFSSGQNEKGEAQFELLKSEWERNPENLRIAILLAGKLRGSGQTDKANSMVEKSMDAVQKKIETEGDSADLYYQVGTGALFLGRNHVALDRFQIALALDPEREEIHQGLVRALLNLGREQEAMDALELAAALFPESQALKRQLIMAHEASGHYDKAIPLLEEMYAMHPEDGEIFNRLLSTYVTAGEAEKASPLFQKLVEAGSITPIEAVIHVYRIYLKKGDLRTARIELQKAIEIDQNHPLVKDAFREYYSLQAEDAEKEDNYRRAILFWQRALENAPDDWQAQYRLASAQAALNNHDEALDLYLPLLEKHPADPLFYANVSKTLIALERFEAANKVLELGFKAANQTKNTDAIAQLQVVADQLKQAAQKP